MSAKVAEALCSEATSCHQYESKADCEAVIDVGLDQLEADVKAGKVKYHPEKVAACLEVAKQVPACSYSEAMANNQDAAQAVCGEIFEGTLAKGEACNEDLACTAGECKRVDEMCAMQCCASTCVDAVATTKAKIGESCEMSACEDGAYCQFDAMGNPTTCAAKAAMGEACKAPNGCKSPSYCQLNFATGEGTCKVPAAHNAACKTTDFIPCDNVDDYCDKAKEVCTLKKLPGEACATTGECVNYARCGQAGKCEKLGSVGVACDPAKMGDECLGGLQCVDSKCAHKPETICP